MDVLAASASEFSGDGPAPVRRSAQPSVAGAGRRDSGSAPDCLVHAEAVEKVTPTAREILGNVDAMELAIDQAASTGRFTVKDILTIHERLMKASPNPHMAGKVRDQQNWVGGNDYNPCGGGDRQGRA